MPQTFFRALTLACGIATAALPVWAQPPSSTPPVLAPEAKPHTPQPFQRVVELEDGAAVALQMSIREFAPPPGKDLPPIYLAAAVHIANQDFYDSLQEFLDRQDLVLFEGVKPPGTGDPAMDLEREHTPEQRVKATQRRIRFIAMAAERFREENERYPSSMEELANGLEGRLAALLEHSTVDAWGRPLIYTLTERRFDIISLGANGEEGGEGVDAEIRYSQQKPLASGEARGGIQKRLADSLGLVFQLEAMDHDKPNWRNSDLAVDQVQERLERAGGNADALFRMLDGSSALSRLLGLLLDMVASSPAQQATLRLMMIEVLGMADRLLDQGAGGAGAMMQVLLEDRNAVVMSDLNEVLTQDERPRSIGIIYGGGHLPSLERQLVRELGYRPVGDTWHTAMQVDAASTGQSVEQFRKSRQLISNMVKRQVERAGRARKD